MTRAVAKLNIDWPAEIECQEHPKSKLVKRYALGLRLHVGVCRFLSFFTLRCLDRGISHTRPASSVLMLQILLMC